MRVQEVQQVAQETALSMIKMHGLRAQAVALERAANCASRVMYPDTIAGSRCMRRSASCGGLRRPRHCNISRLLIGETWLAGPSPAMRSARVWTAGT